MPLSVIKAKDTVPTRRQDVLDMLHGVIERIEAGKLNAAGALVILHDTSEIDSFAYSTHYTDRASVNLAMLRVAEYQLLSDMGVMD